MRYSLKTVFVVVAIVAVLAALVGGAIRSVNRSLGELTDFYAIDQTLIMLTEYTYANEGNWPSNWNDLRSYYEKHKNLGCSEDFEAHQKLVRLDFTFVPKDFFARKHQPHSIPFKLISVNSFRNENGWEELKECNRRLLAMIRAQHETD